MLSTYVYAWHTVTESFVCVSVCTYNSACVCVCACVRACVCVCVRACVRACVCVHVRVCTLRGAFSSWSSKGALAKLKDTARARDIEETIAKSDWSTAEHLLDEVSSGK